MIERFPRAYVAKKEKTEKDGEGGEGCTADGTTVANDTAINALLGRKKRKGELERKRERERQLIKRNLTLVSRE